MRITKWRLMERTWLCFNSKLVNQPIDMLSLYLIPKIQIKQRHRSQNTEPYEFIITNCCSGSSVSYNTRHLIK